MKPKRNPRYLAWIRTQPCLVCGTRRGVEAAHTGPHGIGQKSSDTSAIPLCASHHRTGRDSYHRLGPRQFATTHHLDIAKAVERLNKKPAIRLEAGNFITDIDGRTYVVGAVQHGLTNAVRQAIRICREHIANARVAESLASKTEEGIG